MSASSSMYFYTVAWPPEAERSVVHRGAGGRPLRWLIDVRRSAPLAAGMARVTDAGSPRRPASKFWPAPGQITGQVLDAGGAGDGGSRMPGLRDQPGQRHPRAGVELYAAGDFIERPELSRRSARVRDTSPPSRRAPPAEGRFGVADTAGEEAGGQRIIRQHAEAEFGHRTRARSDSRYSSRSTRL